MTYLEQFEAYAPEIGQAIRDVGGECLEALQRLQVDAETCDDHSHVFDVCLAFTAFWWAWHGGQSDRIYELGSCFEREFRFKPSPFFDGEESLVDLQRDLFDAMVERFGLSRRKGGVK